METTINGYRLYYETTGQGPAFLFIHGGLGGMLTTLAPREFFLADVYQDKFTVIRFDRRSAGQSDYPGEFYSLEDIASDARGLLDHLGIEKAVVMGDSAGGPVALTFALNHPRRCFGLALVETSAALAEIPAFEPRQWEMLEILRSKGPEAAYEAQKRLRGEGPPDLNRVFDFSKAPAALREFYENQWQEARRKIRDTSREDRIRWYAGQLRNLAMYQGVDLRPRLKDVSVPTIVIHGDQDIAVPLSHAETNADMIPEAALQVINGVQHGVMLSTRAQAAFRKFMERVAV